MAFVFGVMAFFNDSIEMLKVSKSTSTTTGVSPSKATTSAVAIKVKVGVITSSPGLRPRAINDIWSASVPFPTGITCFTPKYSSKFFWKTFTFPPLMNVVVSKTS